MELERATGPEGRSCEYHEKLKGLDVQYLVSNTKLAVRGYDGSDFQSRLDEGCLCCPHPPVS